MLKFNESWLFGEGSLAGDFSGKATRAVVALLSYHEPASVSSPAHHWLQIEEQVDGMACGSLEANILVLPVATDRLTEILRATDWFKPDCPDTGWVHDLSWHNTKLSTPDDPTVLAYLQAINSVGLSWTPQANMEHSPYGWRLAQAVYPFDPTPDNWAALGLQGTVEDALGEAVDSDRHVIVLLTPNAD